MLSYKFSSEMEDEKDYVEDVESPFSKLSKFKDNDEHE